MKSSASQYLPSKVRRSLTGLGRNINFARRKRRLTIAMMAERMGVSKSTYQRVEKGDPSVTFGVYAMCFVALGIEDIIGKLVDVREDDIGLLLDQERLPKRIVVKKPVGMTT
jgi:transcriptional regulator with XRE-family HTH domain